MPTTEQPTVKIGTIQGKGQSAKWVDDANGNLIKIIFGEWSSEKSGKSGTKDICFGKEKAKAILSAISEIEEFANS